MGLRLRGDGQRGGGDKEKEGVSLEVKLQADNVTSVMSLIS